MQTVAHAGPPATTPSGGAFVAGQGSIAKSGNGLVINQSTLRGVIDWNSFSIGQGASVLFQNGSGATLNRVNGGAMSSILGSLVASGSVYILNPQGILIGAGARINTGGDFVASTLNISPGSFMAGGSAAGGSLLFAGGSAATVVNLGSISSTGGGVFLIGQSVKNEGSMSAPNGTAGLAAGSTILLRDSSSDQRVYVQAGTGDVTNSGTIAAAQAELRAADGNIYALAGNNGGQITATGTATRDGHIWLVSAGGNVQVSEPLSAHNQDGSGGSIETSGQTVNTAGATISTGRGGSWLLDPDDLTIDSTLAGTIETSLNGGTNVTEQTTASGSGGSGDIEVASNIAWTTGASLTLSAYRNITVDNGITISNSGAGNLTLRADNSSTGTGAVTFSGTGAVDFSASTGNVSILYDPTGATKYTNPVSYSSNVMTNSSWAAPSNQSVSTQLTAYMLINNVTDLSSVSTSLSGTYALGTNIDASSVSNFTQLGSFSGILDGQNNTINGLTSTHGGLIGTIGNSGIVRNLGLTNVSINSSDLNVGGIAGTNSGKIVNTYVTGSLSSDNSEGGNVGGLVGTNAGTIASSYSTAAVNGNIANGGNAGGLIGTMSSGTVTNSYSSGPVTGNGTNIYIGGFLGWGTNAGGSISYSYSSSVVGGSGTTGGSYVGGFVGANEATTISNSYASGPVSGSGSATYLGAFAGDISAPTSDSYAVGAVVVSGSVTGGGFTGAAATSCTSCYWDSQTTGMSSSPTGTPETTAQLQASLPSGLSSSTWGLVTNKSFPYFFWQYPSNTTPQVISGTIYTGLSNTPLTGVAVSTLVNGSLAGVATSTGANGYYNQLLPQDTIANSGSQVLTYISFNGTGNTFNESATGSLTNNNVYSGYLQMNTNASTASQMIADLSTALGSNSGSGFLFSTGGGSLTMGGSNNLAWTSTSTSLVLDAPINASSGTVILNAAGPVTQSAALSADKLLLSGASASYTLSDANNSIGTIAANTGAVTVATSGPLTVGSVDSTNGIQSTGNVALNAGSDLTLSNSISATGSGDAIVLGTGGDLINSVGSSVLNVSGGGRWLVYSQNPANDTVNGLVNGFKQYNATYGVTTAGQATGNGFLYTLAPVLNVGLTGTVSKTYDATTTATLSASNYTLSGAIEGDAVSVNYPTSGSFSDKNVGTGKTVTASGLSATATNGSVNVYGYQLPSSVSGSIGTITPATLTYVANSATKTAGDNNPTFSGTVSGFAGSDTVTSATTGTLTFSSPATASSAVGSYAIDGSGLTAQNYIFTQAAGNATAFTITAAPVTPPPVQPPPVQPPPVQPPSTPTPTPQPTQISVVASNASRLADQPNPQFSASYSGPAIPGVNISAVLSELSLQTSATTTSAPGSYQITAAPLTVSTSAGTYVITVQPGTLTVIDPGAHTIASEGQNGSPTPAPLVFFNAGSFPGSTNSTLFQVGYAPAPSWGGSVPGCQGGQGCIDHSSFYLPLTDSGTQAGVGKNGQAAPASDGREGRP